MPVYFFSTDVKAPRFSRKSLATFLNLLFQKEGIELNSLNYIFCSDEYLLKMNSSYLNHHYYTDILTFDISQPGEGVSGEIYISIDRVMDNAKNLEQPFGQELFRVIFHGALHLCGFKDKTKAQQKIMRKKEDEYLGLFHG